MIQYFFVVNSRGVPVVVRGFLADPSQSIIELFYSTVIQPVPPPPVFRAENLNFCYLESSTCYFVLATTASMAPSLLLELLTSLVSVIGDYAGSSTEWTIQQNLALVYEIVDEVLSFGCPQTTDPSALLHLVHNTAVYESDILKGFDVLNLFGMKQINRPLALTPAQRRTAPSELFLVITERLDLQLSPSNEITRCFITGTGMIKSFLEGQPSVLVQFDPIMTVAGRAMQPFDLTYDDIAFGPFVQTDSFDSDRSISFAPPQGWSTLFHYRSSRAVNPPFSLQTVFENRQAKVVVVRVSISSVYRSDEEAQDVVVRFQCPSEISSASCELPPSVANSQDGEYDGKARQVIWKIKSFAGLKEFSARFRFMFDQGIPCAAESLLGPIAIDFKLPELISGMAVRELVVSTAGAGDPPQRWVKEVTSADCYLYNLI
jgi:AP-4 complex subunit mu-1